MKILAIETSCDETSVAIIENGRNVLSNIVSSQIEIHKEYGGVVPEIASRHHIENILPVFNEALEKANCTIEEIDYIAVTNKPGLIGSLLVGLMFAKSISYSYNKPLIPINHINGHIFSTFIENDIKLPAISLVVSGGHTNLYYIDEKLEIKILGETQDDAIGEAYDKVARVMGLHYPGGPEVDKLAKQYDENKELINITFPKTEKYNFSFSGIKTFVTNYVNNEKMKGNEIDKEMLSKSFQEAVINILYKKIENVIKDYSVKTIMVAGGVSANTRIREKIGEFKKSEIEVIFPSLEYCTDNAAMIACAAHYELMKAKLNIRDEYLFNKNLEAVPTKNKIR